MATDRIALLRPINTAASASAVTFGDPGGTHCHWSAAAGTYQSILTVLQSMEDTLKTQFPNGSITLTGDTFYVRVAFGSGSTHPMTFSDTTIRDLLGFTGNQSAEYLHTATKKPQHLWVSTYAPSDQTNFVIPMAETWQGARGLDGNLAGTSQYSLDGTGNHCIGMTRDLTLWYESAAQVFWSAATDSYSKVRNLEYFINQSRCATVAAYNDAAATGFWFAWDADNIRTNAYWRDMTTRNGPWNSYTGYSWQFCQAAEQGFTRPNAALRAGKTHYNVNLRIHQAEYQSGLLTAPAP